MDYPKTRNLKALVDEIELYAQLKHERGASRVVQLLKHAEHSLKAAIVEIKRLPICEELARKEPNKLACIQALRPSGPRRIWRQGLSCDHRERLQGALLGRMAGCTLGAPVEGWDIDRMTRLANENGDAFPPVDYWMNVPDPLESRYQVSRRKDYTRRNMNGVPVDDDIAYTLLGLLVLENFGPDFTVEENAEAWLKYLPYGCTAEAVALENLRAGVSARRAAEKNNLYCEWIGASIRSDPWGYAAPAWPERAATMAYQDSYLTHRRQGIYGAMFFSAAISAAFAVDDPVTALRIGLTEVPKECALAQAVRWALRIKPRIHDYRDARKAVDRRFGGMHSVHTINNACLTVFGITIGGTDLTRVIGETVAMGMDNDCTAATAGSIVGAVVGKSRIPRHWYRCFNNTVHSYLRRRPRFTISGLVERFARQAARVHASV